MTECQTCGREYKRDECEYCKRKKRWYKKQKEKDLNLFTPRIKQRLKQKKYSEKLVKHCMDKIEKGKDLFLTGAVGCGKTITASAVMLNHLKKCYIENTPQKHLFVSVPNLFQELKSTYNGNSDKDENDIIDKYSQSEFVVFDDLGVKDISGWVYNNLYLIIDYRYEHLKTTIFTSNLEVEHLVDKLGDDRIPSRINTMSEVLNLGDKDRRE